ncbi:glycosyltransferase family 2 protein [Clostridium sp. OS1-26]|uniref:glycosyltransferase family 2 protein n=1 Tax=Clostridium sp. OS1-26 TaxID=3070681 RepID=UPI0027DF6B64|nr:glycosyltransferase family 2 protein [Clostridium sp. OS1-26]WML35495.1 glycosyltransferase family 2 protein [Clostridium sp. OS1-26]
MKNLSIVIKEDSKENIYRYIEMLKPLLEDGDTQLILINNIKNEFKIDYDYIIYEFEEDYEKFHKFCNASSFNDNLMIIEDRMVLTEVLVKTIKEFLLKYQDVNIKANFKKYYDKNNYYIKEEALIYNNKSLREEKVNIEIDNLTYLSNLGINLKHNISRFIQDEKFEELYLWYKSYIIKEEDIKFKFYNYIEKCKMKLNHNIRESIERYFIVEGLDFKYCEYLKTMKMLQENKLSKDNLINVIQKSKFNERDVYFSYIIFECFKRKKLINEIFSIVEKDVVEAYIKNLFDEYKNFNSNIYEFLTSIDVEEELKITQNENVLIYINLIEMYYENTSASFMDKDKKEKLIRLLIHYSNYGTYALKNNLSIDADRKKLLIRLEDVKKLIDSNKIQSATNILMELGEIYEVITLPARYYAQKLIYENKLNSHMFSITMIVKNEEKNLERCLKSIVPLLKNELAELIIVDTGSTDKTVDIAKRYTNRVYFHQWQGDFSEARNWSISLATGEYIFIIDADNEFEELEIDKCIKFFSSEAYKNFNSFSFKVKNYEDENNIKFSIIAQHYIFKNDGTFYYSGTVHNQPNFKEPVGNLDIILSHYGYIMNSKEVREKKFNRTSYILKKELEKDPLNLYYRYQLAKSYSIYGNHKESLNQTKLFMKILDNKPLNYDYVMYYTAAAVVYFCNRLYDETIKICDDILSIIPDFMDAFYFKAQSMFLKTNYREAIKDYKSYLNSLNNIQKNPIINDTRLEFYSLDSSEIAEKDIMAAYLKLENYSEFIEYILDKDKRKVVTYQFGMINSYIQLNKFKELAIFYKTYIDSASENDKLNFSYYIKNEIESLDDNKLKMLLDEFNKLKIKDEYFNLLKEAIEKKEKNSLKDIIRFLAKHDMESSNMIILEKAIYEFIIILINNKDAGLTLNEIIEMRKTIKNVLVQVLNKKSINGLNKEQILKIIYKYMDYSFFIYENSKQSLNEKEILFLENILLAFKHMQEKELLSAVRAIKNAVSEDEDMANAMAIYLETIIPGYNVN